MADLRTDYKDDVLNINTNERRKYRMINNADGTISFEDVTDYVQNGDSFASSDLNAITERVNRSLTGADVVNNLESTATDLPASANAARALNVKIADLNTKLGGFKIMRYSTGSSGINTISNDYFAGGTLNLLFIRVAISNNKDAKPSLFLLSVANDKSSANIVPLSIDNSIISSYSFDTTGFKFNNANNSGCEYALYAFC